MQIVVNGVVSGLAISLLALAFTLVYLPSRTFHLALGGIYAVAPFVVYTVLRWGGPGPLAVSVGLLAGVGASLGCDRMIYAPLRAKGASDGAQMIASLGTYIVLVQAVSLVWGSDPKVLRRGIDSVVSLGLFTITRSQLASTIISTFLLIFFYAFLEGTRRGLMLRGLADNTNELALRGYDTRSLRRMGFGISGLLASTSALLFAYDTGFDPQGGLPALLVAIVATIMGGRNSLYGPVLGGVLVGLVRSEVSWFLSSQWQDAFTFLVLVIIVFLRPEGLLNRRARIEASVLSQ